MRHEITTSEAKHIFQDAGGSKFENKVEDIRKEMSFVVKAKSDREAATKIMEWFATNGGEKAAIKFAHDVRKAYSSCKVRIHKHG
jgi:protein subunit release factor A